MLHFYDMNYFYYVCATYPIYIAIVYAVVYVVMMHEKVHHVRHMVTIIGGAIVAYFMAVFLKGIIMHPRPDLTQALFIPNDIYSFPSGHATFMFTLAYSMYTLDKRGSWVLFFLACVTGIARVISGVHYWYDIVGGIVLAYLITHVVVYSVKKFS